MPNTFKVVTPNPTDGPYCVVARASATEAWQNKGIFADAGSAAVAAEALVTSGFSDAQVCPPGDRYEGQ